MSDDFNTNYYKHMLELKKYIVLSIFILTSLFTVEATPTSFLPMEDGKSSVRLSTYGASIENIKPYRQPLAIEVPASSNFPFGSQDILLALLLAGVYVYFSRRRAKTRCAGI